MKTLVSASLHMETIWIISSEDRLDPMGTFSFTFHPSPSSPPPPPLLPIPPPFYLLVTFYGALAKHLHFLAVQLFKWIIKYQENYCVMYSTLYMRRYRYFPVTV